MELEIAILGAFWLCDEPRIVQVLRIKGRVGILFLRLGLARKSGKIGTNS
jgi:hypothetical protein